MIAGKSGSGKDIAADYIVHKFGYKKMAFAESLKNYVSDKYRIHMNLLNSQEGKKIILKNGETIRDILIKEAKNIRTINESFFADTIRFKIDKSTKFNYVISDFRFPIEYNVLSENFNNVTTVRIDRNLNNGIVDPSETQLENFKFDHVIENNGSLDELYKKILFCMVK